MDLPVSVGMPVFNGERYLAKALDSILGQTYADFELVISDNASVDGTREICEEFARRDSRVRYFRQPVNLGAPRNFNFVFERSRGHYFKWASSNDLCDPDLLRACKSVLDERPESVLCFGRAVAIDEDGNQVRAFDGTLAIDDVQPSRRFVYVHDRMGINNVHAGLFRSAALRRTKPEQTYPSADLVRIAELALYGTFVEIPQVLFYRREVPGMATKFRSMQEIVELRSPGCKQRWNWPTWRRSFGYFEAVLRSPIALSEKAAICVHLLKSYYWDRRIYWRELCMSVRS